MSRLTYASRLSDTYHGAIIVSSKRLGPRSVGRQAHTQTEHTERRKNILGQNCNIKAWAQRHVRLWRGMTNAD